MRQLVVRVGGYRLQRTGSASYSAAAYFAKGRIDVRLGLGSARAILDSDGVRSAFDTLQRTVPGDAAQSEGGRQ